MEAFLKAPPKETLQPLRSAIPPEEGRMRIFRELGERLNLPVFQGVPTGHGTRHHALWLGKRYSLDRKGFLSLDRV